MNALIKFKASNVVKGATGFFFTALLLTTAVSAQVASGTTGIDATGNASSEMAACNNGTTQQDRATCITEVKNANAAKRAGQLDNASQRRAANALERCQALSGDDKVACEARMAGYGETEGSVAGGGVIREIETVVVPKNERPVTIQLQNNSDAEIVAPATR